MKISRLHRIVIAVALFTACTHDTLIEDSFADPLIIAAYENDTDGHNSRERKADKGSDPGLEEADQIDPNERSETGNQEHDNNGGNEENPINETPEDTPWN